MLPYSIASQMCRSWQNNDCGNDLYIFVMYVTNINNTIFSPKRTRCRNLNMITQRIAKDGAKSETEIIRISTNLSFVSYNNDEGIFHVSLLDLDFCLEYLTVYKVLS